MDQQGLGDLSSNQQSSAEKKELKIKLKKGKFIIDQADCESKHVISSQREYDQAIDQMLKSSVPQWQSNQRQFQEKWSKKQVKQFDQDFSHQQLDKDSSNRLQITKFYTQLTGAYSVPLFSCDDWNQFYLNNSEFKIFISLFNDNVWVRLVSYDEGQVEGMSHNHICLHDLFNILRITTHIGISYISNYFEEEINILQMKVGTFTSEFDQIYYQLLNVANGMTPEGKSWREKGSSTVQLKIVGETEKKEIAEFIIGGQNSEEQNIFISQVIDQVTKETVLFGENQVRSIWLRLK